MHRVPKDLVRFAVTAANGNFYEKHYSKRDLHVIPYLSAEAVLFRGHHAYKMAIWLKGKLPLSRRGNPHTPCLLSALR
jgi:hypothetical protein